MLQLVISFGVPIFISKIFIIVPRLEILIVSVCLFNVYTVIEIIQVQNLIYKLQEGTCSEREITLSEF